MRMDVEGDDDSWSCVDDDDSETAVVGATAAILHCFIID